MQPELRIPHIPDTAPFTAEQRAWLNGFLAGWLGSPLSPVAPQVPAAPSAAALKPLLILFGSQSGSSEALAKQLGKEAASRGYQARVCELNAVAPDELARQERALIITSTWGQGEMPDNAAQFWDALSNGSPRMENLRYSVLALGDSNYGETFCRAGRLIDDRLAELGATRLVPRADCDTDYEEPAKAWMESVWKPLSGGSPPIALTASVSPSPAISTPPNDTPGTRRNPWPAPLIGRRLLNGPGSAKEVNHIAFSLEGSGISYEAGDALGVQPTNCPEFVREILEAAGLRGDEPLDDGKPLFDALLEDYELRPFVTKLPAPGISPGALVGGLKRLAPRLYSISSSPKKHPGQVHLTVSAVRFTVGSRPRKGVCSTFLADRLAVGQSAKVFVQPNKHFRLPADSALPVVMVGPGTGIAPFRAFLEERQITGATGRNWLFFGDQHRATDFLYREEIEAWLADGTLTRLHLAFSRDQAEKIYVQNKMIEAAADLWSWLEEGAHFYVCGDASRMAKDVEAALLKIAETCGGHSAESAQEWLGQLKSAGRYQRDVY